MSVGEDPVLARRAAVAAICERAARSVVDRVVDEAVNAAHLFGLDRAGASAYAGSIEATLPEAFAALRMADGSERTAKIGALALAIRRVSESHHIPRIVERGLVAIAVRISREVVRRGAAERGFAPEDLEQELSAFADQLEDRLFRE